MEWQAVVLVSFFSLLGFFCVLSIPFGLPGLWMLLGFAFLVELGDTLVVPQPAETTFGWGLLAFCGGLGVLGEVVEAVAGAAGTRMGGGTSRGMWGAVLGGLVGAVVFTLALPVPLVGTLIGALLGTFVGAFVAEATGEEAHPRATADNLRAAFAATVGRLAGTLGKTMIAAVIWVLLVWNAFGL
jgi:uncharacterized protein YqgC (DUF456 family)